MWNRSACFILASILPLPTVHVCVRFVPLDSIAENQRDLVRSGLVFRCARVCQFR